jgi:hypothetical protein
LTVNSVTAVEDLVLIVFYFLRTQFKTIAGDSG